MTELVYCMREAHRQSWYSLSVFGLKGEHTPAQHVSQAHKAHISQLKGAAVTGLEELLTEVQSDPLHLQQSQSTN